MKIDIPDDDIGMIHFLLQKAWEKAAVGRVETEQEGGMFINSHISAETRALERMKRFETAVHSARMKEFTHGH